MITINNLSLAFDNKIIFDNYSYTFELGKIYCIQGQSGCGKTTLLRVINGLLPPDKGSVLYNNIPVTKQKQIFMMHQSYCNFPWKTALENVLLPLKIQNKITPAHISMAKLMLNSVELYQCENMYPYEFSGGMNQRLALARVLITQPKVILMDEPLSALDPFTRTAMQDLIIQLHRLTQNTIIMVTHDPNEAQRMADIFINLNLRKEA